MIQHMKQQFKDADANGDKKVTRDELYEAIAQMYRPQPPPPAANHGCECFGNGSDYEQMCQGHGFNVDQCLSMNDGQSCHWGPGEFTECQDEARMYWESKTHH